MSAHGHLHTVTSEDAHDAATRDREHTARMVLDLAVKEAIDLLRLGTPGAAEYRLSRAAVAARRILGTEGPPIRPGVIWVTKGSTLPIHTCSYMCAPSPTHCCWSGVRRPHTFVDGVCQWCHHVEGTS